MSLVTSIDFFKAFRLHNTFKKDGLQWAHPRQVDDHHSSHRFRCCSKDDLVLSCVVGCLVVLSYNAFLSPKHSHVPKPCGAVGILMVDFLPSSCWHARTQMHADVQLLLELFNGIKVSRDILCTVSQSSLFSFLNSQKSLRLEPTLVR